VRKRILSPGFFQSEELGACSPRARLLFAGLWLLADREGRLRWNPLVVHGQLFPFEPDADVPAAAEELTAQGLVECYEVTGRKYMQIPGWSEHQRPHPKEAASKIPSMIQVPTDPIRRNQIRNQIRIRSRCHSRARARTTAATAEG